MHQAAYHVLDGRFWLTAVPAWGREIIRLKNLITKISLKFNHKCNKIKYAYEAVAEFFLNAVKFNPLNTGRQHKVKPAFKHHASYICTVSDLKMSPCSRL